MQMPVCRLMGSHQGPHRLRCQINKSPCLQMGLLLGRGFLSGQLQSRKRMRMRFCRCA